MRSPHWPIETPCTWESEIEFSEEILKEQEDDLTQGKYEPGMKGPFWVTILAQVGAWDELTRRIACGPNLNVLVDYLRDGGYDRGLSWVTGSRDGEIETTLRDGGTVVFADGTRACLSTRQPQGCWPKTDSTDWDPPEITPEEKEAVERIIQVSSARDL